mmetsp:Transcript_35497/g.78751  ORF Transcript_35497/g.78751 Transcript_35497/m.78751 type:complete len:148 (+) Transcript_35497:1-444(+)
MIDTIKTGMAAAGHNSRLRGIVWVQGEGDATDGAGFSNAMNYYNNFKLFVSRTRQELSQYHTQLPIITAVMATKKRSFQFPYIAFIRTAQDGIDIPDVVKVDMEGLEFFDQDMGWGPQWTHLSKKGTCALGVNLANAWMESGLQYTY